jgi:hypothetical protein
MLQTVSRWILVIEFGIVMPEATAGNIQAQFAKHRCKAMPVYRSCGDISRKIFEFLPQLREFRGYGFVLGGDKFLNLRLLMSNAAERPQPGVGASQAVRRRRFNLWHSI